MKKIKGKIEFLFQSHRVGALQFYFTGRHIFYRKK